MSVFQAIILGLTQGVTEFAPVSSSGHLILVPWLFNWHFLLTHPVLNKTFDVALHMGTFLGAIAYFWRDVVRYLTAWVRSISHRSVRDADERVAWLLIVGTIPGAIAGAVFEQVIEKKLGQPGLIAIMLAAFGVLLYVVDKRSDRTREIDDLHLKDALLIGIAQAVALQPGVSRSGVTITAARALGVEREDAARFSFLLALPIIGGAGALKAVKVAHSGGLPPGFVGPFFWGFIASAVTGFLIIWLVLSYVRRGSFAPFVIYRVAVAVFVLALIVAGVRGWSVPG
ncbi:MAG: undecaprenyl-diphosphate phosphatase [Actinomycetota bacterium]|nr:undecaprenyl-diphosphate phosphatase [Actinomycetota bacterium]